MALLVETKQVSFVTTARRLGDRIMNRLHGLAGKNPACEDDRAWSAVVDAAHQPPRPLAVASVRSGGRRERPRRRRVVASATRLP